MRGIFVWFVFVMIVAVGLHYAAVRFTPDVIMWRVMSVMSEGAGVNVIQHGERVTAASRRVVRPSPDLLYSSCAFDVSTTALRVVTAAPTDTYWSVSFFAANTDNFYVMNDRKAQGQPATIILKGPGAASPSLTGNEIVVEAPTATGVVLFRTLINDTARFVELDQARRQAECEPM